MADATDLKSVIRLGCAGSTPAPGTKFQAQNIINKPVLCTLQKSLFYRILLYDYENKVHIEYTNWLRVSNP